VETAVKSREFCKKPGQAFFAVIAKIFSPSRANRISIAGGVWDSQNRAK
jgi:hypothetical protein